MRLKSKVALITGGYGGMGRASARLFAREGATVFVAGRSQERGDALVAEINSAGGKSHFVELDVVNQDQWDAALAQVKQQAGALHVLLNIVGSNALVRFPDINIDEWNKIFETNVTSTVRAIQTCAPLIRESGGGSIVNIGSVAGITGNFGTGYSSSKWALEGVSRSAAYIYADWGIRSERHPARLDRNRHDRVHAIEPTREKDAVKRDEKHYPAAPERQSRRNRLHGPVPGQRRILLHHRHRYRGRWRMVLRGPLPHQRTIPSHAPTPRRQGQGQ